MNLKKYSWLAVLPMLLTACQDDVLVENQVQGIRTLTATMDGGVDSRAQIVLDGVNTTREMFHWNKDDEFTLFQLVDEKNHQLSSHTFKISDYKDENPTATANFTTDDPLTGGRKFAAFYPKVVLNQTNVQMKINNNLENNTPTSWTNYFKNNMFMKQVGTVANPASVKFEQLCGIIRITYTNTSETDRTFDRISVNGDWTTGGYYDSKVIDTFVGDVTTNNLALSFSQKAEVKAKTSQNFYILFLKNGTTENTSPMSQVIVDVDLNDKASTMCTPGKILPIFETGKCHWLKITDDGNELSWTNGTGNEEGEGNDDEEERDQQGWMIKRVKSFEQLKDALSIENDRVRIFVENDDPTSQQPVTIEITEPLIVQNTNIQLYLQGNIFSLSPQYDSEEPVFKLQSGRLNLLEGTIKGLETESDKNLPSYFFESNGNLIFDNITFNVGKGIANGIELTNASLQAMGGSTITVNSNNTNDAGYAVYWNFTSTDEISESIVDIQNGVITGNIGLACSGQPDTNIQFRSGTIHGNLVTSYQSVSSVVKKAEKVSIGSNYQSSWANVGVYYNDIHYKDVSKFTKLQEYLTGEYQGNTYIYLSGDIELESPLTVQKTVNLDLRGHSIKLKSTFDFGQQDAAITSTAGLLEIINGTIEGFTPTGKYLLKKTDGDLNLFGVVLEATSEDSDQKEIKGNGVHMLASNKVASLSISGSTINGHVAFTANCAPTTSDVYRVEVLKNSNVDGNLSLDGNYKDKVVVSVNNSQVSDNWNATVPAPDLNQLKAQFNEKGRLSIPDKLVLPEGTDLEFVVGNTQEDGSVLFRVPTLTGKGTVKFVNNSSDNTFKPIIYIDVTNLGDDVDFEFVGNFQKNIVVGSKQIQKVMDWAQNQDEVWLNLTGDVTLTQTLTSKGLTMLYGSKEVRPGMFTLNLNGHSIKSEMTAPAIEWKNGVLRIESGNIQTTNDAIHVGAVMTNETDNGVVVMINAANITSTNGHCVYIHSVESATSDSTYKTADVEIGKESILEGASTVAIALDEDQYKINENAHVINNGGTISPDFVI